MFLVPPGRLRKIRSISTRSDGVLKRFWHSLRSSARRGREASPRCDGGTSVRGASMPRAQESAAPSGRRSSRRIAGF
ncbi:hypothetical protein N136_01915 [Leifsonia aquatica ATCC 14665]|uniref:Uncharacterized protein n=1 Tax=Leifsonia aquatica ATCC 14665 TaxID=1358026 RepID=U2RT43_LEIAQ|nr:hypothetical protein N136_01915 [Leifsonia aquatica ATCC 14665]